MIALIPDPLNFLQHDYLHSLYFSKKIFYTFFRNLIGQSRSDVVQIKLTTSSQGIDVYLTMRRRDQKLLEKPPNLFKKWRASSDGETPTVL